MTNNQTDSSEHADIDRRFTSIFTGWQTSDLSDEAAERDLISLILDLLHEGRAAKAGGLITKAAELLPTLEKIPCHDLEGRLQVALRFEHAARINLAIPLYRKLIDAAPENDWYYFRLASALDKIEQTEASIEMYRRAITLNPEFAGYHHNLGNLLFDTDVSEAIASYRRAIALAPDSTASLPSLASALEDAGEIDEAKAVYSQFLARLGSGHLESFDDGDRAEAESALLRLSLMLDDPS